jgi:hypothetical protein
MTKMKNYKVDCDFMDYALTAVVACEKIYDAVALADYEGEGFSNQEVTWIGDSTYLVPTLICCESL